MALDIITQYPSHAQIPLGIGVATCIRVGQFLGAGKKLASITATRVGITVSGEWNVYIVVKTPG